MSEKITFKELVEKISAKTKQSEQSTDEFIHQLAGIIEESLGRGDKISVSGFGKFELRWMNERPGRNPQTGEQITIPGQNKVVFKPYKHLRDSVNKPYKFLEPIVLQEIPKTDIETEERETKTDTATEDAGMLNTEDKPEVKPERVESLDELIKEKPSPVEGYVSFKPEKPDKTSTTDPDAETGGWEEMKTMDRQKLSRQIQENGRYRWSYTAASVVVMLAILLLIFTWYRNAEEPGSAISQNDLLENIPVIENRSDEPVAETETSDSDQTDADISANRDSEQQSKPALSSHKISAGESLWTITEREYGNPYLWPAIYFENRNSIENPNQIIEGSEVQLPSFEDPEDLSAEEREKVALGYISVYDWVLKNRPESARYYLWAAGSFSSEVLMDASDKVNDADLAFATQR